MENPSFPRDMSKIFSKSAYFTISGLWVVTIICFFSDTSFRRSFVLRLVEGQFKFVDGRGFAVAAGILGRQTVTPANWGLKAGSKRGMINVMTN